MAQVQIEKWISLKQRTGNKGTGNGESLKGGIFNPFPPKSDFIDFTLSNARRLYSSKGDPLGIKGLKQGISKSGNL